MSAIFVAEAFEALTADGGTDGFVTVTSNAKFYPGAECWLVSDTQPAMQCIITELSGSDKVGLRFVKPYPTYGRNPCDAYTTADNASINMPSQVVRVNPAFSKQDRV